MTKKKKNKRNPDGLNGDEVVGHLTLLMDGEVVRAAYFKDRRMRQYHMTQWMDELRRTSLDKHFEIAITLDI